MLKCYEHGHLIVDTNTARVWAEGQNRSMVKVHMTQITKTKNFFLPTQKEEDLHIAEEFFGERDLSRELEVEAHKGVALPRGQWSVGTNGCVGCSVTTFVQKNSQMSKIFSQTQ